MGEAAREENRGDGDGEQTDRMSMEERTTDEGHQGSQASLEKVLCERALPIRSHQESMIRALNWQHCQAMAIDIASPGKAGGKLITDTATFHHGAAGMRHD